MTACPKPLQYVPVSTRTSPVTQVADVAVNKLVRKSVGVPRFDAAGKQSSALPSRMIARKTSAIICGGRIRRTRDRTPAQIAETDKICLL